MKKEPSTIIDRFEEFAAKMADREDNPPIHELAKKFPDKTYKELENYRDSDRQEEAKQVPLTEAQRNLVDHIEAGTCIIGEARKDREGTDWKDAFMTLHKENWRGKYEKEHRLRQEAEGELSIMKGIETNRVKEAQEALANALEVNESHQRLNGKLQVRIAELEDENKKIHDHLNKKLDAARKSGL